MRIKPFEFKKTKHVKTVVVHQGLSVDLTVAEAGYLSQVIRDGSEEDERATDPMALMLGELLQKLEAFVAKNS